INGVHIYRLCALPGSVQHHELVPTVNPSYLGTQITVQNRCGKVLIM
ncbi:unnamed protein product, partial [Staurois parvus]